MSARPCRECRAQIELIRSSETGAWIPGQKVSQLYVKVTDEEGDERLRPVELNDLAMGPTFYVSHYQTCPDSDKFKRRKKAT